MPPKIRVETTPTPSSSETEESETEEVSEATINMPQVLKVKETATKKSKTYDIDELKKSVLSLVAGAINKPEPKPRKVREVKKPLSEAQLETLRKGREVAKKNKEERDEIVVMERLKKKGYKVTKDEPETKTIVLKKYEEAPAPKQESPKPVIPTATQPKPTSQPMAIPKPAPPLKFGRNNFLE